MFALEHNAAGVDDACLQGLATCFPGAWDEASYEWYLKRPFQARRPDMITARDGTQVVGGLGINYRRLRATDGFHDVGVLTAAWTLPKHQGLLRRPGFVFWPRTGFLQAGASSGYGRPREVSRNRRQCG